MVERRKKAKLFTLELHIVHLPRINININVR